jgi:hypothetical protein
MAKKLRQLTVKQLASVDDSGTEYESECIEIEGLVGPRLQGCLERRKGRRVQWFTLVAWRPVGGRLSRKPLLVFRPLRRGDNKSSAAFAPLSLHRLLVLMATDRTRAIAASRFPAKVFDRHLTDLAQVLSKPVVVRTRQFGVVKYNCSEDWVESKPKWLGKRVRLWLHADDGRTLRQTLQAADALWDTQSKWHRRVVNFAVDDLLPTKNDIWLIDDEKPLTRRDFARRIRLNSIQVHPNGKFEFWFDDDFMFLDHAIVVEGTLKRGPTTAYLAG